MSRIIDFINFSKNEGDIVLKTNEKWIDYKQKKTFEERQNESQAILNKYKDKVPVIINECSKDFQDKIKRKMLVQKELTITQYLYNLRTKFNIGSEESLVIFVNNSMPMSSITLGYLYEKSKDKDGFLYITILKENAFG
jgi:GABA(A) receptor-associated protein